MELENLEKNNTLDLSNINISENDQKDFLETTLGKAINTALNIGIRALLPNFVEDQIINVKDNLFNYGFKDGISKTIDDAIELGKSATGIITGKFENVSQMQEAVKSGGLIDGVSSLIDTVLDNVKKVGVLDTNVVSLIKQGKNVILNNVETNIEKSFTNQYKALDDMNKYIDNWKECYESKDFNGMEKEYKKLEKQINNIAPIEKTINEAKTIEILHNLIKNNGQVFDLTDEQLELAERLR